MNDVEQVLSDTGHGKDQTKLKNATKFYACRGLKQVSQVAHGRFE